MSKLVVIILNKIVWLVLTTSVATQALQTAGVVNTPLNLGDITYNNDNEYEFGLNIQGSDGRGKRQTGQAPVIENIFNIPIATLGAVSTLVQSTRPAFERIREHAHRHFEMAQAAYAQAAANSATTRAPRQSQLGVATGRVQKDGSSSKVLLDV